MDGRWRLERCGGIISDMKTGDVPTAMSVPGKCGFTMPFVLFRRNGWTSTLEALGGVFDGTARAGEVLLGPSFPKSFFGEEKTK